MPGRPLALGSRGAIGRAALLLFVLPWVFLFWNPAQQPAWPGRLPALHLLHLLYVLGLALLMFCWGRSALRRSGFWPQDPFERLLLGTCAGYLLLGGALFLLASAGLLRPLWIWAVAAGLSALALRGEGEAGPEEAEGLPRGVSGPERLAVWGLGALLALLMLGGLAESLYPWPQTPDSLAYHLAYPRLFAREGGFVFTPESPAFFALSGYWEVFLAGTAAFVPSDVSYTAIAQILHFSLGLGGTALGIFCLVRRFSGGPPGARIALGLFGALLFAGMRPEVHHVRRFPFLPLTSKQDLLVAAFQVAGLLLLCRAAGGEGRRPAAAGLWTGAILGMAAGLKYTGGLAGVAVGAAFVVFPHALLSWRERGRVAGWCAAGFALSVLPALAKNTLALGNPVYPGLASLLGAYDNPAYFSILAGFRTQGGGWHGLPILLLAFPSAAYLLLAGALWRGLAPRLVYMLLLAVALAALLAGFAFSGNFPLRYVLFVPAFSAACAALVAGGLHRRLAGGRGRLSASAAGGVFWAALLIAAVQPMHLDNRLKRAWETLRDHPNLEGRFWSASPTSRFQAAWPGRLPPGARPMTFYRPERLAAFSAGFRPAVAVEDPAAAALFARERDPARLEAALAARGITHVYFESRSPVPPGFPLDPAPLVARLRGRPPLWREGGFEMYALRPPPRP